MYGAVLDAEKIIKWCSRLLYLSLFLVLMMAFNLWTVPLTMPYLCGIMILVFTGLNAVNNREAFEELDDMYLEDISGYKHILEN